MTAQTTAPARIDQPAAPARVQLAATVTDLHTDPYVEVTGGGQEFRLRIDLVRVFERTSRPIIEAVLIEAGRLLRRHAGYAPSGMWRRTGDEGAFTAALAEIPGRCLTCIHGCKCGVSSDGCVHFGCLFVQDHTVKNSCAGVAVLTQPRRPRPPVRSPRR